MEFKDVLNFWFKELTPKQWFAKSLEIDQEIKNRFSSLHLKASRGELSHWRNSAEGRLAEIIVLDQFSRNIHRDSKRAFQSDELALTLAQEMVEQGLDKNLPTNMRVFIYMPYMHSENLAVHQMALELFSHQGMESNLDYEKKHRSILEEFGRYPHRNRVLGRKSTKAEVEFLKGPDSSF